MTRTALHSPTMGDLPETAVVAPAMVAAPGLAWSAETDTAEPELEQPSRRGAVITGVAVATSIAAVIGAVHVVRNSLAAPTPTASTAESVIVEPAAELPGAPDDAVAPQAALTTLPDAMRKASPAQIYITVLSDGGIDTPKPEMVDSEGRAFCMYMSQHGGPGSLMENILATGHFADGQTPTPQQAATFVRAAIVAYCPQYGGGI